jgi:glutamyl-tRNA synthetase
LVGDPPAPAELALVAGAAPIIRERLKLLADASGLMRFLLRDLDAYDPALLIAKKSDRVETLRMLESVAGLMPDFAQHDDAQNEARFRALADSLGVKLSALLMPLRVALSGSAVSPPLFESMRLLGADKILERIARAKTALAAL